MTIDTFLEKLHGVRRSGDQWMARCPAHEDKNPSLSVAERDGKILVNCQAGCPTESVCTALKIEMRDLFISSNGNGTAPPRIVAEYNYHDEAGELLYQVVRYEPKDFRQRRPDGNGWIWRLGDVRRVLYRLPEVLSAKSILILEGEKDCEAARTLGLVGTTNCGGAGKWRPEYSECLHGKRVVIVADADEPGRKHAEQVALSLHLRTSLTKIVELPGAKDLSQWLEQGGTKSALLDLISKAAEWSEGANAEPALLSISVEDLLAKDIRPREMLLSPVIPEQGLVMMYAYRGVGKTYLALGIAGAVASGSRFLKWSAPRPNGVLYIDGELPAKTLQVRIAAILAGMDGEPAPGFLKLITPDFQDRPMPDLSSAEGQRLIEPHLEGVKLVVIDNLSALCHGDENDGQDWLVLQSWALRLRRSGISVLILHHEGKNGTQRGISRREDLLDFSIRLKSPSDWSPSDGLRCEVHFKKIRNMLGDEGRPFEVRMETGGDGRAVWTYQDHEKVKANQAAVLFAEGMSVRDVAEELEISKSQAGRLRRRWQSGEGVPLSRPLGDGTVGQSSYKVPSDTEP